MAHTDVVKLTIAIPSYNRPKALLRTINILLPQLNEETTILVMDNSSDVIIKDYILDAIDPLYVDYIDVKRNFINIGADGNFMRSFEFCKTPFVWILADDDEIMPDAVSNILKEIHQHEADDIIGFNFGSNYTDRQESFVISNIEDLSSKMENFENFLFLSTSVYKREEYIKLIRFGYWGAYSMASQIIPCMIAIGAGKKLIVSKYKIVTNVVENPGKKWSDAQQALALSSILEAPLNLKDGQYKKLGKFLFRSAESFPRIFCDIVLGVNFDVKKIDDYHRYIYRKIYKNSFEFRPRKLKQYILYRVYGFLLICKPALKIVLKFPLMRKYVLRSSKFVIFNR